MNTQETKTYPSIAQSIGITGILILAMLFFSPILFTGTIIGEKLAMMIYYIFAMGIPFWIVYAIRKDSTGEHSFNFRVANGKIILLLFLATIGIQYGLTLPLSNIVPAPEWAKEMFERLFSDPLNIFLLITIVVLAPVFEELIFRGIVLNGLLKRHSPTKAILVSSFLFGVVHLNPWQFISAFILGIFIGWIYYKTRSISFAIIIHAFNNFIAALPVLLGLTEGTFEKSLVELFGGLANLILIIVFSLALLLLTIYLIDRIFHDKTVPKKGV